MTVTNNALARVLEGADSTVRIQDDLFRAINGSWIDSHEIPTDLASDGSFTALALQAEEQVRQIIEELAAANPTEGEAGKIARLFNSWMDVDTLNAKGTAPLEADLAPVEAAANREELARAVGALSATGVHAFFSYEVASDLNDPSRYTVFVSQSGIGLPDEAYYRDPGTPACSPSTRPSCRVCWPSATAWTRRPQRRRPAWSSPWRGKSPQRT